MDKFETELEAMQWVIRSDCTDISLGISRPQLFGLNGLLRKGLSEPDNNELRISVVKLLVGDENARLTGVEFDSTRKLTAQIASYLIGQLLEPDSKPWRLSDHGIWLINEAEKYLVKSRAETTA